MGRGKTNPSTTLDVFGNINCQALQEGGTLLSSKYLQLDGSVNMTGALNATTLNATQKNMF